MSASAGNATEDPAVPGEPSPAATRKGFFIARHWRGDYSLAVAYWLISLVASVGIFAVIIIASALIRPTESTIGAAVAVSALWLLVALISVWQMVGVWRSAGKHKSRGGRGFWAVTARVVTVFGGISLVSTMITQAAPQTIEYWRIAGGDSRIGKHELHVLRGGTELEYVGGITFGASADVEKILDATPTIRAIHLNSQGGRLAEARKLRDLIRQRGLVTYTATNCASACTVAFMGGKERLIAANAKLGFHQGSFPGVPQALMAIEISNDRQAFLAAGVPGWFVDHAFTTPSDSMWWPTIEELKSAHVVTAIATPSDFAISGFVGGVTLERVDRELGTQPLYVAIRKADPDAYAAIRAVTLAGMKEGKSVTELATVIHPQIVRLAQKYLAHASDEALVEAISLVVSEIRQLGAANADACHNFLSPQPGMPPVMMQQYVDAATLKRDLASTTAVITTALDDPQPIPAPAEIVVSRTNVIQQLHASLSPEDFAALANLNAPTVSHAQYCRVTGAYLAQILALPDLDRAKLLRVMFGGLAAAR